MLFWIVLLNKGFNTKNKNLTDQSGSHSECLATRLKPHGFTQTRLHGGSSMLEHLEPSSWSLQVDVNVAEIGLKDQ